MSVDDDGETHSTASRYWLTNDLVAGGLVLGYFLTLWLVGTGHLRPTILAGNSGAALYVYVGIAIAWAFGAEAVKAWRGK